MGNSSGVYDDMISLPHHISSVHPQMDRAVRAAQFAPFAALTGHGDAILETARLTERRKELDETGKALLDYRLQVIQKYRDIHPELAVTFFQPDDRKDGGAYETVRGNLEKIDRERKVLVMGEGKRIPMEEIVEIESDLFQKEENLWYD